MALTTGRALGAPMGVQSALWSRDQTAWTSLGILLLLCKHKEVVEDVPRLARGREACGLSTALVYAGRC